MYKELIQQYCENNKYVRPQPPAEEAQIRAAEAQLGVSFPQELKNLLLELNGDRYLCFSAEEIAERNLSVRERLSECYDGLEDLLFVAGNGCGDYYGYRIRNGICEKELIYWCHETNETKVIAGSLAEMIELYYTDRI